MDARTVVAECLKYWSVQDVECTLAFFAEDAVYTLNIDKEMVPLGGETRGREAIRAAFYGILADWDYIRYLPTILTADERTARVRVDFTYRHRKSGRDLTGSYRLTCVVENGRVTRVDEYQDRAFVEAFMAMAAMATPEPR